MRNPSIRAGGDRRARWKAAPRVGAAPRSRMGARIAWSVASAMLVVAVALLVVPPLFMWHAAVVQLTVDEYDLGMISAVPFGARDADAVAAAVEGRLSPALERTAVRLEQSDTAAALRDQLRLRMAALPLRARDVLVTVVRAQAGVWEVPGPGNAATLQAALFAGDAKPADPTSRELVPCRDLFSACAASPARTTLVAIDFGDIRWDPRLGIVGGLVPALLDEECKAPIGDASGGDHSDRACWVLGSHDTLECSAVSLAAGRSLFSRALELALAGAADDPRWGPAGGDGDGTVELDELVRFTAAWTSHWARIESDGESDQRPVLWKLGRGRVAPDQIPQGIPIIRVGTKPRSTPHPGAGEPPATAAPPAPAPAAGAAPPSAATASAPATPTPPPAGTASDTPPAPADTEPSSAPAAPRLEADAAADAARSRLPVAVGQPDLRAIIDRMSAARDSEASPVDSIPHLWRDVDVLSAAIGATVRDDSPMARRAALLERRLAIGLDRLAADDFGTGDEDVMKRLAAGLRAVAADGVAARWKNAPPELRRALQARNRAVELAFSTAAWIGQDSGCTRPSVHVRGLLALVERIAALNAELERVAARRPDADDGFAALDRAREGLQSARAELRAALDAEIEKLLARAAAGSCPAARLRWLAASRLPTPDQYSRLTSALVLRKPAGEPPVSAGLPAGPLQPMEPAPDLPRSGTGDALAWRHLAEHADVFRRILRSLGAAAPRLQRSLADLDVALDELVRASAEPAGAAVAAGRLGMRLAAVQAAIPAEVAALTRAANPAAGDNKSERAVDALLRLADARDALRIPLDARGWVPAVRPQAALALSMIAAGLDLDIGRPQRVTTTLASGASFPGAATLQLDFDATKILVRGPGGDPVEPGRPFSPAARGMPDRAVFEVTARRRSTPDQDPDDAKVSLTCSLEAAGRRERTTLTFNLPVVERIAMAVRGPLGTVEMAGPAETWTTAAVEALEDGERSRADATVTLRPFPGHVTEWEIALVNQTANPRRVSVDLLAVDEPPGGPQATSGQRWSQCLDALAARRPLPAGVRVVGTCAALELPGSDRRVPLALVPPPAAPADVKGPPPPAADRKAEPLSATLALVVRDAVEPAGKDAPPRPTMTPQQWVFRVRLAPQHPRRYLDALARWSGEGRRITVALRPRGDDVRFLPPLGSTARAAVLESRAAADQPLALQEFQARVTAAQPVGELRARWNGVDEAATWLAIDIDGHPRARVFRVECSQAATGIDQRAQEDWKNVEIRSPARDYEPFKASTADIPLDIAVDAPPDMFGPGAGRIEIAVSQDRALAGGAADAPTVVWSATTDRDAAFSLEQAEPPQSLAVRTVVSDWRVPLRDLGYQDVDVLVEARLFLPGEAAPRTARRIIVLDGSPPRITVPARVVVPKGRLADVVATPDDGLEFNPVSRGRRAGASGIDRVEWGIDAKGNGAPEKWEPAGPADGGRFRIAVATETLNIGRHRLLVRTFDRVGFESRPAACELEVMPPPSEQAATPERRNAIRGRVTLEGRPHAGAPVTIEGPGAPGSTTSGPDGGFEFPGLEPGEYRLSVREFAVRNRLYAAGPVAAVVMAPPAGPSTVELPLK